MINKILGTAEVVPYTGPDTGGLILLILLGTFAVSIVVGISVKMLAKADQVIHEIQNAEALAARQEEREREERRGRRPRGGRSGEPEVIETEIEYPDDGDIDYDDPFAAGGATA